MKTTETKRPKGSNVRAPEVRNYDTYSRYQDELEVLDTDEDVILQYYIIRNNSQDQPHKKDRRELA